MSWILIVMTLVALLTGGTVYAADQAAPGDLLYPLDRAIENLRLDLPGRSDGGESLRTRFEAERMQEAGKLVQEDEDGEKEASRFCDPISADNPHPRGWALSDAYGVDYETVMGWFCGGIPGGKDSYGFGEIMHALQTSDESGEPVEDLLAERASKGWGEIWQELGLLGKPGENEKGPPFEVPKGPKKDKGKPPDVPKGPPEGRGKPADE